METKLATVRPLDRLDADRWQEIVEDELFKVFVKRVRAELQRSTETCLAGEVDLEVRRSQGAVHAYETVLRLPDLIAAELKAGGQRYVPNRAKR